MSLLEHQRDEEILEEAKMELIVIAMERKWQWFWHMNIRKEIENVGAVAKMEMDRGRPRLRRKDTVKIQDTNQFIGNHVGWIVIYIIHNTIQASSKIYIHILTSLN